jgi:hypothetical protein
MTRDQLIVDESGNQVTEICKPMHQLRTDHALVCCKLPNRCPWAQYQRMMSIQVLDVLTTWSLGSTGSPAMTRLAMTTSSLMADRRP